MESTTTRRDFLRTTTVAAALTAVSGTVFAGTEAGEKGSKITLSKGDVILFQGDSITDAGRKRDNLAPNAAAALGTGYAFLAASALLKQRAELNLSIYNRGISGNKVYQVADRWDKDCLELKPNVLSILIGVNDYWHKHNGQYNGTVQTYHDDLVKLLDRTKQALPDVKLIMGEPYAVNHVKAVDDTWYPEFNDFRAASLEIAKKFGAVYIPYQKIYDDAAKTAPGSYWTADGVHPSMAGAQLMADAWLQTVK